MGAAWARHARCELALRLTPALANLKFRDKDTAFLQNDENDPRNDIEYHPRRFMYSTDLWYGVGVTVTEKKQVAEVKY